MIIYRAYNQKTCKYYIGQTIHDLKTRKRRHVYDAFTLDSYTLFAKAIRKYGQNAFIWDVIDDARDIQELDELEAYYIDSYDSFNDGYNMTTGGQNSKKKCRFY
jgi:group I intron endonuclease